MQVLMDMSAQQSCNPDTAGVIFSCNPWQRLHLLVTILLVHSCRWQREENLGRCCRGRHVRAACSSMQAVARGRCIWQAERAVYLAWWGPPYWTGCFPAGHVCWPGTLAAAMHAYVCPCVTLCHGTDACMRSGAATRRWCWKAGGGPLTFAVFGWLLPTPPASAPSLLASSAFAFAVSGYAEFAALPSPTFACFMLRSLVGSKSPLCPFVVRVTKTYL